ncbi:LysR family transcriptional regulator substrate-binding protein [Neobacillus drentensis]|uniref:LysR family transcriptional regulator substrate-binding protein n=1 Tax=Neobacillus drentensis TaxID=220684 RepID=UPI003B587425
MRIRDSSTRPRNEHKDLDYEPLLEGDLHVFVSNNSPLAVHDSLTMDQLVQHPFVFYNTNGSREIIQDLSNQYGKIKILCTSNNTDVIKKTVARGFANCFTKLPQFP